MVQINNNRTVLITGASAGIGRAFAEVWAEAGFNIFLTARREERLQEIADGRSEFFEELAALGVEMKDPNKGLVDFPALLDDRVVYLCWKLGEETVEHWHELTAGFDNRESVEGNFVPDTVAASNEA